MSKAKVASLTSAVIATKGAAAPSAEMSIKTGRYQQAGDTRHLKG